MYAPVGGCVLFEGEIDIADVLDCRWPISIEYIQFVTGAVVRDVRAYFCDGWLALKDTDGAVRMVNPNHIAELYGVKQLSPFD